MVTYLTKNGKTVDAKGNVVKAAEAEKPSGPFADLSPAVQKSLAEAGVTTVAEAQALGKDGLVKLPEVGAATADKIMALKAE